jgi:hypothetical protein
LWRGVKHGAAGSSNALKELVAKERRERDDELFSISEPGPFL